MSKNLIKELEALEQWLHDELLIQDACNLRRMINVLRRYKVRKYSGDILELLTEFAEWLRNNRLFIDATDVEWGKSVISRIEGQSALILVGMR